MNFTPPDKFAEEWKKRISDISNSEVKTVKVFNIE